MSSLPQFPADSTVANEKKLELANTLLSSLRAADWHLFRSIFDENATWTLPGKSLISGDAIGLDAVVEKAQTIVSFGINFQLNHILYGSTGVALSLHNQGVRGDKLLDEYLATVCYIKDGKIAAINTFLSDVDMANAFFTEENRV